jgi:hypothetical protein
MSIGGIGSSGRLPVQKPSPKHGSQNQNHSGKQQQFGGSKEGQGVPKIMQDGFEGAPKTNVPVYAPGINPSGKTENTGMHYVRIQWGLDTPNNNVPLTASKSNTVKIVAQLSDGSLGGFATIQIKFYANNVEAWNDTVIAPVNKGLITHDWKYNGNIPNFQNGIFRFSVTAAKTTQHSVNALKLTD